MTLHINKLLNGAEFVKSFSHDCVSYTLDHYALTFFQKAFCAELAAVYSDEPRRFPTKREFNIGCSNFIIVNAKGRIFELTNSEWGSVNYLD